MRSPFSLQTPKGGAVLETISTKSSISIKNKYSNELLPVVGVIADYMAIWLAEYVSYGLRDFWVPETHFHLSWLSIHVIIPVVYILFLQLHHLYTRRMQFWQVISSIFKSVFYAIALLIFFIYIAQTAAFRGCTMADFFCFPRGRTLPRQAHLRAFQAAPIARPHHGGR